MLASRSLSAMRLSSRLTSLSPIVPHLQSLDPCVHLQVKYQLMNQSTTVPERQQG